MSSRAVVPISVHVRAKEHLIMEPFVPTLLGFLRGEKRTEDITCTSSSASSRLRTFSRSYHSKVPSSRIYLSNRKDSVFWHLRPNCNTLRSEPLCMFYVEDGLMKMSTCSITTVQGMWIPIIAVSHFLYLRSRHSYRDIR